jgi:CAAX prenyl protease-like protein
LSERPSFKPWIPRVVPFALYMLFILLQNALEPVLANNMDALFLTPVFYSAKILLVTIALIYFWKNYDELTFKGINAQTIVVSLLVGVLVFVLWINLDLEFAKQGKDDPYDPTLLSITFYYIFIAIRLFGASLVVPVFEELFWRSFILRYIVNPDFKAVKLATFTWPSFIISSVLFGLEHNLWLAGIVAGVFYNLLLYKTRNLYCCILAHGITNFILGLYVLKTGGWSFW